MAIAQWKPEEAPRDPQQEKSVVDNPGKHEIYDHRTTPLWSLDAFLEGSQWEVTYFAQRLGVNDTVKKLDHNLPPSVQSYNRYEKLELLVSNALNPVYNSDTHEFTVSGVATIPSFMVPNVEDTFYAIANMGRMGLFYIKRVERVTNERESAYNIEYEIRCEITEASPEYQDLQRKTTHPVFVYSKQRLIENRNPILIKDTYQQVMDLRHQYLELANFYFDTFLTPYERTFILPGQTTRIYDPYLSNYMLNLVSPRDVRGYPRMNMLSINNDSVYDQETVWSAMFKRGERSLNYVRRQMGVVRPGQFEQAYFGRSATYGNTDYILYPMDADTTVRSETIGNYRVGDYGRGNRVQPKELILQRTTDAKMMPVSYVDTMVTVGAQSYPVYTSSAEHTCYLFSAGFYDGQPESLCEIVVLDYLRRSPVSLWQLNTLIQQYPKIERLDQFNYGPFLITLIKEADRGAYA